MESESVVHIVEDDDAVRNALLWLIGGEGYEVATHASAEEFLDAYRPGSAGCMVLDLQMPGMSGLDLQEELARREIQLPIIVLTATGTIPAAVKAVQRGAVDFLEKPHDGAQLLHCIQQAIERDLSSRSERARRAELKERLEQLTTREREVFHLIVEGKANKAIGIDLGISERTVELHRSRVMNKLEVRTLPDLVRLAAESEE